MSKHSPFWLSTQFVANKVASFPLSSSTWVIAFCVKYREGLVSLLENDINISLSHMNLIIVQKRGIRCLFQKKFDYEGMELLVPRLIKSIFWMYFIVGLQGRLILHQFVWKFIYFYFIFGNLYRIQIILFLTRPVQSFCIYHLYDGQYCPDIFLHFLILLPLYV